MTILHEVSWRMEAYLHILHEDFFLHSPLSCVSIAAGLPAPHKQG